MRRNARFPTRQRVEMHVFDVFCMYAVPGCIRDVRGEHARFPTLQRVKMHVFDVFCRFPTVECAEMHVFLLARGSKCTFLTYFACTRYRGASATYVANMHVFPLARG